MTSSLVGSEMCIRDSCSSLGRSCSTSPRCYGERTQRTVWRTTATEASPVSYTHLTLPTICSV
eukprot:7757901-Prorocentrum_lima.AAC.1